MPGEPGGTRHYELGSLLAEKGHGFTVIASDVSYLTGNKHAQAESPRDGLGVHVLRARAFPSLHKGFVWRVASFFSFMASSFWASLRSGPADVVMGTTPPIFQAVSACLAAKARRKPFLLEVRDLWPAFAVDMGVLKNPRLIKLAEWLENTLYDQADRIVVNSPAYREHVLAKGVPPFKVSVIPNGVDPSLFDPAAKGERIRHSLRLKGKFVVTYAGALGLANDLPTLLCAAEHLVQDKTIHFILVGDGMERRRLQERFSHLGNVTFVGAVAKSLIPDYLAASDACVATLQNIPMFRTTYPNKVFDYMAAGRPTVLAIDGVIRHVVEEARGGICVTPGDDAALAEAIRSLAADRRAAQGMGAAARAHVEKYFQRRVQAGQLADLVTEMAGSPRPAWGFYRDMIKPLTDRLAALFALSFLWPLMAVLAFLVYREFGRPVLFKQRRPGFAGRPFTLLKFRTMRNELDGQGRPLPDEERLTRFGRWLRGASLDELPSLLNVLRGEMSWVGPRPLLMEYLPRYSAEQFRRHQVKPGVTGWAQISGRNAISWEEKFCLDVWYVDHGGFWMDMRIILRTFLKVLKREGVNAPGNATMPLFEGPVKHAGR